MAEPKYNETPTRADYNRSAEFKVDKKDDFWKMVLPFALGLLLGWAGAEMADNASQESTNYRGDGFHGTSGTSPGGTGVYTTPGSSLDTPSNGSGMSGNSTGSDPSGSSPSSPGTESSGTGSGVGAPGSR